MNQLVETYNSTEDDTDYYYYDVFGNLTQDGSGLYAYDYRNRLQSYVGDSSGAYVYYIDGLRKSKTVSDTTYFIWLDGNMVYEFASDDSNTYTYGHRLLYSDDVKYILNAHGDVVTLLNVNGETVKEYDYDAFGDELNIDTTDTNPFRYCGEYFDVETGQIYLRNRYYQPLTGRFSQLDPIKDGLNWYAYCTNNPVVFVDFTGLFNVKTLTRSTARAIIANPIAVDITKSGEWQKIFKIAGFDYNSKTGTYHAHPDAWQQIGGYNELYNVVFDHATDMKEDSFDFYYDNQNLRIWIWKGDYLNLGAGSEMGIYKRGVVNGMKTDHWVVDRSYSLHMSVTLVGEDGQNIIYEYSPTEKQWWITGFNPAYQNVSADDLTSYYRVIFDNSTMYGAFKSTMIAENEEWSFNDNTMTAYYSF